MDRYQETYFVIDAFGQLFEATAPDFTPLYRELARLEDLAPDGTLPEDRLVS
jgi:phenylalanine-4-hydroxylase